MNEKWLAREGYRSGILSRCKLESEAGRKECVEVGIFFHNRIRSVAQDKAVAPRPTPADGNIQRCIEQNTYIIPIVQIAATSK